MSKLAIITGGSRGIGEAMSMKLGEMGYNVVINYRSNSSKALTDAIVEKLKATFILLLGLIFSFEFGLDFELEDFYLGMTPIEIGKNALKKGYKIN